MKTTKSLFPWFFGAPRSEKETPQPQLQIQNPMEQQTRHRTNRKPQNPIQKQTPNQTTRTMKLRNTLNTMNFFQTLHNWLSGLLRSEKETPQPQTQTQNPMEQHQTKHRTNRKPQNPKPCIRLFSPLTNAITAFLMSAVLICIPFVPIQADEGISGHYCWEIASNPGKSQPSCECHSWLDDIGQPNPRCESSGKFWPRYRYCEKVYYHHDGNNYNTWCDNNDTVPISYSHCVMRWNPIGILGCAITITGCVVACGGVAFGWGSLDVFSVWPERGFHAIRV